jgi:biopolymer transport protein ExbB/biopolymer transport protein TolQ
MGSAIIVATALLVAIPAVAASHYFGKRAEAFEVEMGNTSSELIDYFVKRRGLRRRT